MAYSSGSGAGVQDLLDAIETFAETDCGFTVEKSAAGILMLSYGACRVALQYVTKAGQADYSTGSNVPFTDDTICGDLATTLNTGLDTFYGHTGNLATGVSDGLRVECNGLVGPYTAWHLFGDTGFCHVVVQVSALRYAHLGFGVVDQGALTHSGAAYLTALAGYTTPQSVTVGSKGFDEFTLQQRYPYLASAGNGYDFGTGTRVFALDAMPTANRHLQMNEGDGDPSTFIFNVARLSNDQDAVSNFADLLGNRWRRAQPTAFGSRTVMLPIPVIGVESNFGYYLGQLPEVRYVNMVGLSPGQEIDFSSDTWQVFPLKQQNAWGTAENGINNTLQYGLAFKKVV